MVAGSSSPGTYSTESEKQHPLGTLIIAVLVTLPYVSTAAGTKIALDVSLGSPFTAMAMAMGPTVPLGMAMLPLNVT